MNSSKSTQYKQTNEQNSLFMLLSEFTFDFVLQCTVLLGIFVYELKFLNRIDNKTYDFLIKNRNLNKRIIFSIKEG